MQESSTVTQAEADGRSNLPAPPSGSQTAGSLDNVAIAAILLAIGLFALVFGSPFSRGLLAGAILCVLYGRRTGQSELVMIGAFMPLFGMLTVVANRLVTALTPHTIDSSLLVLDRGFAVSVFAWCRSHRWAYLSLSYVYLYAGAVAGIALCFSPRRGQLVRAILIASLAAPFFYFCFPAVGPAWVGSPALEARNCVPSLHFTWTILFWIYSPKRLRAPMFLFMLLTAAATIGLGEHYAIDLVAALPFTWGVVRTTGLLTSRSIADIVESHWRRAPRLPE